MKQFRVVMRSIKQHYLGVEKKCGVSGAQLWALAEIGENPGIRVGDLAQALAIHQSTASNLLARLHELGLIKRTREGEDRRAVQIKLTAKGRTTLRRAPRPFRGVLQQALAELSTAALQGLHKDMERLIRRMKIKDRSGEGIPISAI